MTSLESLFFKNEITLSAYRGTFVGYNERINRVILFSVSNVCIFAAARLTFKMEKYSLILMVIIAAVSADISLFRKFKSDFGKEYESLNVETERLCK